VHTLDSPKQGKERRIYLENKVKPCLELLELKAPAEDLAISKNNKKD
jgi:hypothetical protein